MIRLTRNRAKEAVHPNFRGTKRLELNLTLLKLKREGKLDSNVNAVLKSAIWGEAKKQLLEETHEKCAYCETPTSVVAYGDVEHFRPKSTYWWLAYCYENYLASCTICNQRYKKDHFSIGGAIMAGPVVHATDTDAQLEAMAARITVDPVDDTSGMPLTAFTQASQAEQALLLHPYFDDPTLYLAYKPILASKEILIVPTQPGYQPIIDACDLYFGINRKELVDLRFQHYCTYMTYKHTLTVPGIPQNIFNMLNNRLQELKDDFSRYAGMIRFLETQPLNSLPWDFNLVIT